MTRPAMSCVIICIVIVLLPTFAAPASAASVPQITGISPSGGPITGGTVVIITGSGFFGAKDVEFGGKSGTDLQVVNDSRLTIITPPNPEGTVPVSVISAAGAGVSVQPSTMYEYDEFPFPRLSGISPASGPMNGGTLVAITGSGFSSTGYVYFGKYLLVPTIIDDSHLTVTTVPSLPGLVPVRITNAHGTGVSQDPSAMYLFEFPLPELTHITPSSGSSAGGTVVTITGSGFSGATSVSFGGINGTGLDIVDDNLLTSISPPNSAGTIAISVINPAHTGSSTGSTTVFRYDSPVPRLTDISPSSGSMDGGTVVTLTGSGFTGTIGVSFGEKPGSGLKVIDDGQLTIITPASRLGSFPIAITNAYGEGGSLGPSTSFRYVFSPSATTPLSRNRSDGGDTGPTLSFPATSPAPAAPPATAAPATRAMPGFEAVAGLSALGAIILLGRPAP